LHAKGTAVALLELTTPRRASPCTGNNGEFGLLLAADRHVY